MTIDDLNQASEAAFTMTLGTVYEHSPWIAQRTASLRPFDNVADLHGAMSRIVRQASVVEQMTLVSAHPDLGGRLARAGNLAPSSADEQASLGLDRLSDAEFELFESLNAAYRARFGFPFVIAVRRHTRASVLVAFEARLKNGLAAERHAALQEIDMIAGFRLDAMFGG